MIRRYRGFTLIELLVVIAIIAILAAMLFPVFARARESARKIQCLANVKNIATAFQMYLTDYDRMAPGEHRTEVVQGFNVMIKRFPTNLYAGLMGFKEEPFYPVPEEAKATPKVDFGGIRQQPAPAAPAQPK